MTTNVITLTNVVNNVGDNNRCRGHARDVTTLLGRLEWICKKLGEQEGGPPISMRELARRASKLSAGGIAEPTISMMVKRLRENPNGSMQAPTAVAIAAAGGVSVTWLTTGKGTRDANTSPYARLEELFAGHPDEFTLADQAELRSVRFAKGENFTDDDWRGVRNELRAARKGKLVLVVSDPEDDDDPGAKLSAAEARKKKAR